MEVLSWVRQNENDPKMKTTKKIKIIPKIKTTTKMKSTKNMKMTKNMKASQQFNSLISDYPRALSPMIVRARHYSLITLQF